MIELLFPFLFLVQIFLNPLVYVFLAHDIQNLEEG